MTTTTFADQLRLVGIRLKVEEVLPTGTGTPVTRRELREAAEVPQLESYFRDGTSHVAYGIAADYHLPDAWFAAQLPNCEVRHLWLDQRFLFSRFGRVPPHEPSGALDAARCHPIVKYAFTPNAAVDRTQTRRRIVSIRFDYRLALRVDATTTSRRTRR